VTEGCHGMKIFITGSNGMVGRNLLENEAIRKHDIFCPKSADLDLLNYNAVHDYIGQLNPDMIIHCAGQVGGIQANMKDMYGFLVNNVVMGANLVKAAKEQGIQKLLNLSSSCVYPCDHKNPLKEEYILTGSLEPTNEGYALAKLTTQKMCEYITKEFSGFQYKTLIPCNLYGRWDKFNAETSHMLPSVIQKMHDAIQRNKKEIVIWGDGTARREFMYAADLASGIAKAITDFDSLPVAMNIGLGFDYSINEYYEAVKRVLGYEGTFTHNVTKPTGMKQKLLDISQQKIWGWKASISLEEGIQKTYKFFLEDRHDEIRIGVKQLGQ
jgi:GDP-L-fucose synthase